MRHAVLGLALLLAVVGGSAAKSHRPPPSSRESVEPPQTQSTQTKEPASQYQRGTEESPAFVKIIPPPDEQQRAASEAKREEEKAANDRSIALFTGRLFWATVALSVIAVGQLFAFLWQGFQLKRTVDLARQEFIAARRPRLKIREIEWDNSLGTPPIKISYAVINVGDTHAHIFERRNRIYFTQADASLHGLAGWTRDQMFQERITLPGGGKGYVQYETSEKVDDRWPNRVANGTLGLKLVGEIGYRDDNGVERWVGFLRQYDWEFRRFRIMDDPDHEYQD